MCFTDISPEELVSHRNHDLCYYCDECFTTGHHYEGRFLVLLANKDNTCDDFVPLLTSHAEPGPMIIEDTTTSPIISFNAIYNMPASETFRLYGHIVSSRVTILVDSESTHNFVQTKWQNISTFPRWQPIPFKSCKQWLYFRLQDSLSKHFTLDPGPLLSVGPLCPPN